MKRFIVLSTMLMSLGFQYSVKAQQAPASSLKEAYADAFKIGMAIGAGVVSGRDAGSQALVIKHANAATPENVMKPGPIHPSLNEYNWAPADEYVAFAQANKMFVQGHTLVWHNQTPDWFFQDENGKPNTPAQQIERMRQHIQAVAGRYAGKVQAWDVVNEIIGEDGKYRQTNWVTTVGSGDEVVKNAFRFAAQYAPNTELYYNEFNEWRPEKRDGIVRMVKMLQAEGIRIDGIGMQAHWGLNYPKAEHIEAAIDAFAALGVKVMISELDIDVLPFSKEGQVIGAALRDPQFQLPEFEAYLDPYKNGLPDDVQMQLTKRYEEIFKIFYNKRDKIDRVTFWGVHDGNSWKNGSPVPGRTNYPMLFDRQRAPKPALNAVLAIPAATKK
jgi:endo-1,4-beta-xylanase